MMIICCMVPGIWSTTDTFFCHFGPVFVLYSPPSPNNPKMKETPGDIIILHMSAKNHDHMLNCS